MYQTPPCRRAAANLPVFLSGEDFVQPIFLHDQSKLSAPLDAAPPTCRFLLASTIDIASVVRIASRVTCVVHDSLRSRVTRIVRIASRITYGVMIVTSKIVQVGFPPYRHRALQILSWLHMDLLDTMREERSHSHAQRTNRKQWVVITSAGATGLPPTSQRTNRRQWVVITSAGGHRTSAGATGLQLISDAPSQQNHQLKKSVDFGPTPGVGSGSDRVGVGRAGWVTTIVAWRMIGTLNQVVFPKGQLISGSSCKQSAS